jgi:hypothetical protein
VFVCLVVAAAAASCSGSEEKRKERAGAGEGGQSEAGAGSDPKAGKGNASGSAGIGGSAGAGASAAGGSAGEGPVDLGGAGGVAGTFGGAGAAVSEGGASAGGEQGGQAGQGGSDACCSAASYDAPSSVPRLPSDDACSPWKLLNATDNEQPTFSGQYLHLATSTDAENMYYIQDQLAFPATFTFEARIKLVTGSGSTASRGPAAMYFVYGSEHRKNMLQLTTTQVFILASENVKGTAITFDTTSDFHTYKIVANTVANTFDVFIDDELELSGGAFVDPGNTPPVVGWGEPSTFASGSSQWEFVRHNAYHCAE